MPRGGRCPVTGEQLDGMGLSCLHTSGAAVIARHDSVNRQVVQLAKRCTQGVVHTEMLGCFGDGSGQKRGDCVIEGAGRSGFREGVVAGVRQGLGQAGLEVCDTAVSAPHAASYVQAAQQPLGTATAREGSKESKHGEHVRQGGGVFTPLVWESFGALGSVGVEWWRRMLEGAEVQGDTSEERGRARGQLSLEFQRRVSCALQRGNARTIISRSRQARDRMGHRVYMPPDHSELDFGSGQ